jgi:hemin uptake protein HemP
MLQTHPHAPHERELISIDEACATAADMPRPPHPQWNSDELLGAGDEALIVHRGDVYRLRRTLTGKLILTK